MHEVMRMAWFTEAVGKKEESDGGNVTAITALPQVSNWIGPPPIRPQDVINLAERMKKHG